jgi:predicted AlkP superfamily pyrophosphatase or phosphodiesterase
VEREHLEIELQTRPARRIRARDRQRHGEGRHRRQSLGARARLVALLLLAAAACATGVRADPAATVIVISLDGVRWDYPGRGDFPALARMQREGARARRMLPSSPASTFPAHVTLATGAPVERHGIVANRFLEPGRGIFDYSNDASWILAEPLWIAAERQGVKSAVFFWVGSETDWHGQRATYREAPFSTRVRERRKVEQILAWLDLPPERRPRLIMTWWHGADDAGHAHGPDAPEIAEALRGQDAELGRLLRGLDERGAWPHTTLIAVSDHGMALVKESIDVGRALRAAHIRNQVFSSEGVAYIHLNRPEQVEQALGVLRALPGVRAEPGDGKRSGNVVVHTDPPRRFSASRGMLGSALAREPRGAHGYSGDLPEMGAIFFALGRGAPAGKDLGVIRSLDVAPTVAALLGIEPPRDSIGSARLP